MLDTLGSWVGITCTAEQQKNLKSRVDFTIHEQFIIFFNLTAQMLPKLQVQVDCYRNKIVKSLTTCLFTVSVWLAHDTSIDASLQFSLFLGTGL